MRKLVKPWNTLPAGASVTTNPAEQVVLVDKDRFALLEKEGHLAPTTRPEFEAREIPAEVRTVVEATSGAEPAKTAARPGLRPDKTGVEEP